MDLGSPHLTVRDVIGDLPAVPNGHDKAQMPYVSAPTSAFQRRIRNGADQAVIALALPTCLMMVDDRFAWLDALRWSALLPCDDQSWVARSAGRAMEAVSHHR
jgi:hypothetical protein